jgi:RNA polymerase sigma factor (sigma-70 family)
VSVKRRDGAILRRLQTLYNIGTIGDLTDGQLLERFAIDADELAELAFAALVERHQAMVWRVCLAILRNEHLAEDAMQATFMVLVRRARTLWVRDSLGPWLHQVACRTASCLRATATRRRRLERRYAENHAPNLVQVEAERCPDQDAAVHEEVIRLPEKYRAPVVLCDLEGRTHREAARFLGWPIGTVKSRQSQGRGLIRDRLVRRGFGLAAAGAVVESMTQAGLAAMPRQVSEKIAQAAIGLTGRGLPVTGGSAHILTLAQGVLRAMLWGRLRVAAVAVIAIGIGSGGAIVYVRGAQEAATKDAPPVSKRTAAPTAQAPKPKVQEKATGEPSAVTALATLKAQQFATRKAKIRYEMAKLTRELNKIAVEEYQDVTYPASLADVEGEIPLAEAELIRAMDRVDHVKRMDEIILLFIPAVSEELNLKKAQFHLEQAMSKRKVLVDYTRDKNIKELTSEVWKAESDELAKKATWELESLKEKKMERELKAKAK